MKEAIETDQAHRGFGPYSQAIKANGFLFVSGQLALSPITNGLVAGGFEAQVRQVIKNLTFILVAGGSSWEKVVKTTVYLTDMDNFTLMNEIYERALEGVPPVRTTIEASRLPKDALVEIDVIALA